MVWYGVVRYGMVWYGREAGEGGRRRGCPRKTRTPLRMWGIVSTAFLFMRSMSLTVVQAVACRNRIAVFFVYFSEVFDRAQAAWRAPLLVLQHVIRRCYLHNGYR